MHTCILGYIWWVHMFEKYWFWSIAFRAWMWKIQIPFSSIRWCWWTLWWVNCSLCFCGSLLLGGLMRWSRCSPWPRDWVALLTSLRSPLLPKNSQDMFLELSSSPPSLKAGSFLNWALLLSFHSPWLCLLLLSPLISHSPFVFSLTNFLHSQRAWLDSLHLWVKKPENFFFLRFFQFVSFSLFLPCSEKICTCTWEPGMLYHSNFKPVPLGVVCTSKPVNTLFLPKTAIEIESKALENSIEIWQSVFTFI